MAQAGTRRTPKGRVPTKPTRRRVCPRHGWVNAVKSDSQYVCPIDGSNAMTEHEYALLCSERNARRLLAEGG